MFLDARSAVAKRWQDRPKPRLTQSRQRKMETYYRRALASLLTPVATLGGALAKFRTVRNIGEVETKTG